MKRIQNVFVLALIATSLTFFYACDREECEDHIPVPVLPDGIEFPSFVFAENASIAEMLAGRESSLIGYLATEARLVYVDFQHYETVQAEMGAHGFEEVWFVPDENSSDGIPYEVQPIESLDWAAIPKAKDKFTIKKAKCVTLKKADGDCYNIGNAGATDWPSFKLKVDVKICEGTDNEEDICTFTKVKKGKVTAYSKKDCDGEKKETEYFFPDC